MASTLWTRESIRHLLRTSDKAVLRAIVVLYDRQTCDEKVTSNTHIDNQRGFSAFHARSGSKLARLILKGYKLYPENMDKALRIALHHAGQLAEVANTKAAA